MPTNGTQGFSVVEALVAVALLGLAGSALAAAFGTSAAIRSRATADGFAAAASTDHIALLARRACSLGDTSARAQSGTAAWQWRAVRLTAGWQSAETVTVAGSGRVAVIVGAVPCPP